MPKIKKEVHQYDLEGNYIASYSSILEASKAINTAPTNICTACDLHYKSIKGYRFTSVKHIKLFKYTTTKGGSKKVYLYNSEGNLVKEFRTQKEAASFFNLTAHKLRMYLKEGVIEDYKISSIKVDKFVEFKSRRFISN